MLLFPFSILYGGITDLRNYWYDSGWLRSFHFRTRVIAVGNLNVGGSGKSPMIEYLIRLLSEEYSVATLSRGYGRRTRGFRIARQEDSARSIGDEPLQYFRKFHNIHVTVGEERAVAIPFILAEFPDTEVILLDDAFQHRPVHPDLQLLITEYGRPFYKDVPLPAGDLRERRKGARRADVVVVSKCPAALDAGQRQKISEEIRSYNASAPVFFTSVRYGQPVPLLNHTDESLPVVVVSGIANPVPFEEYVAGHFEVLGYKRFPDHHAYTAREVGDLVSYCASFGRCRLLMTEKDAVKLSAKSWHPLWEEIPLAYIPIQVWFLHEEKKFRSTIRKVAAMKLPDSYPGESQ